MLKKYPKLLDPVHLVPAEYLDEQELPRRSANKEFFYFIAIAMTVSLVIFVLVIGNLGEGAQISLAKFLDTVPFFDLQFSTQLVQELKFPSPVTNTIFAGNACFLAFILFDIFRKEEIGYDGSKDLFKESGAVSYAIHIAILLWILLTVLVSWTPKPKVQVTRIEYIPEQIESPKPPPKKVQRRAAKQSIDQGKHDPTKKVKPVTKAPGKPRLPPKPIAKPKPKMNLPKLKPLKSPKPVAKPVVKPVSPPKRVPPKPKAMIPRPKILRDAIHQVDKINPNAKTLPKLLTYNPNSNVSDAVPSPSPSPKNSGQAAAGSSRNSNIVTRLSNIPRAPDAAVGFGQGGGGGQAGNPGPNQYPGRPPSTAAQADVNFGPYMSALQRKIKMAWKPPRGTESNRIVVTFTVRADGSLADLRVVHKCDYPEANLAALEAVSKAAPFKALPAGAGPQVDIEFTFDYNVFQKTRW